MSRTIAEIEAELREREWRLEHSAFIVTNSDVMRERGVLMQLRQELAQAKKETTDAAETN